MDYICGFDECERRLYAKGLCQAHYNQGRRGCELAPVRSRRSCVSPLARDAMGRKMCTKCTNYLGEGEFCKNKNTLDGLSNLCRSCSKDNYLAYAFGMTLDLYNEMLDAQGGACAICGTSPKDVRLAVDHDHSCCPGNRSCGKCVRQLLCFDCNTGLGSMKDDVKLLRKAIEYLEIHSG